MMIQAVKRRNDACYVDFVWEKDPHIRGYKMGLENLFSGNYLDVMPVPLGGQTVLLAGCGKERELTLLEVKELMASVGGTVGAGCGNLGGAGAGPGRL